MDCWPCALARRRYGFACVQVEQAFARDGAASLQWVNVRQADSDGGQRDVEGASSDCPAANAQVQRIPAAYHQVDCALEAIPYAVPQACERTTYAARDAGYEADEAIPDAYGCVSRAADCASDT